MLNIIVAPFDHNSRGERYTKRIVKYLKNQQEEYSVYFSQSFEDIRKNVKELVSFGQNELFLRLKT